MSLISKPKQSAVPKAKQEVEQPYRNIALSIIHDPIPHQNDYQNNHVLNQSLANIHT